jgi:AbrB family looped-hinge helix DNA binding protein
MRVTIKGQVTIPREIRDKMGITPYTEVDFIEEKGRICLVKKKDKEVKPRRFRKLRGSATVRMTTDQIMALTRGNK